MEIDIFLTRHPCCTQWRPSCTTRPCLTTEMGPRPCVSFRAAPSPNVGSMVAMGANFRPSVICCDTSAKSRDKHLRPHALTVAQSSRGQQQGMDTSFTKSARRRGKDRQAATDGQNGKAGKQRQQIKGDKLKLHKKSKGAIQLAILNRDTRARREQLGQRFSLTSLHFDFLGIKTITLLYEMVCLVLVLLPVFGQWCEEAEDGHVL